MNDFICDDNNRYKQKFNFLPDDQGGAGRHRCAGSAYEAGYQAGSQRQENLILDLDELPESQAGTVRHKSPHAAYAQGYYDGVVASYK
ncbi:MAG: hypothetical protein C0459_12735 [Chitinophaga sp.]|jgi:hypothetical protein|nr:hypothetical protein [Chitinophaga sp.]